MVKEKKERNKSFSFEKEMERLEKIVKDLESGDLSLESSIAHFEQGVAIFRRCRGYLESARQRVEVLLAQEGEGGPVLEPFEEDLDEDEEEEE